MRIYFSFLLNSKCLFLSRDWFVYSLHFILLCFQNFPFSLKISLFENCNILSFHFRNWFLYIIFRIVAVNCSLICFFFFHIEFWIDICSLIASYQSISLFKCHALPWCIWVLHVLAAKIVHICIMFMKCSPVYWLAELSCC